MLAAASKPALKLVVTFPVVPKRVSVTPLDVLIVVNELNSPNTTDGLLPAAPTRIVPPRFLDVNADGYVAPIDVLRIVNFLNAQSAEGEGEFAPVGIKLEFLAPAFVNSEFEIASTFQQNLSQRLSLIRRDSDGAFDYAKYETECFDSDSRDEPPTARTWFEMVSEQIDSIINEQVGGWKIDNDGMTERMMSFATDNILGAP